MQRSPRSQSRPANATAERRRKQKPRLALRTAAAQSADENPPRLKLPATAKASGSRDSAPKIRLARGTSPAPTSTATDVPATVTSVEIRPAGTVVSRRPAVKRTPVVHVPLHPAGTPRPPAWMLEECHVAPARAGDQSEILQLLAGLPSPPTRAEFHAAVDHPDHDANNRLVGRLAGRIVGHAEIVPRQVMVGTVSVRGAVIDRVAVLPECRGAGHGQKLVRAAEERMRQSGAVLALTRTRIAPSFRELGWSVLGRDRATPGRPTEILARLLDGQRWQGEAVTMRQWRHVELPAILRIYRQNATRFVGPLDRDENYARWLVSRGAFDSIIVALVGQDRYEIQESSARIVGYAIQSGTRVLEIMADQEFAGLEREILARVCAEAVENDRQEIVFESGASDPLHAAVAGSEGAVQTGDRMIVGRVYRPLDLLAALVPAIEARVAAAGIRETVELGLDAPGARGSVIVTGGKAAVHVGRVGRSYLKIADEELARLLLGQCDPAEAEAAGRLEASTQVALKLAGQLFPRQPLWCPMWDDLPA